MMFDQYKLYARTIDYFDKDGFLKEYMQFDTTGTKVARGLRFIYDSIHRITGETIYENYHFDTSSKKFTLNEKPDTIVLLFIHDTINGLIKKTGKNNFIRYACEYNYKTFTETDTFFLSNGITNIGIAHVDHPFIEKDVKCFSHSLNGD